MFVLIFVFVFVIEFEFVFVLRVSERLLFAFSPKDAWKEETIEEKENEGLAEDVVCEKVEEADWL